MVKNKKKLSMRVPTTVDPISRVRGVSVIPFTTSTSAAGLFVLDTYDLDSTLLNSWGTISSAFEKWRIVEMQFQYVPNTSTQTVGTVYMACTDDPNETSPVSNVGLMNVRTSNAGVNHQKFLLNYKPSISSRWLFTRDQLTSDDRLEMPGVFFLATEGFAASVSPGRVIVRYVVDFKSVSNTAINTLAVVSSRKRDKVQDPDKDTKGENIPTYEEYLRIISKR